MLQAYGYVFDSDIVKHTVTGEVAHLQQKDFENLNDASFKTPLNTHIHGRDFHHELADIGLKIGLSYDQTNLIVRRLFSKESSFSKRILDLEIRLLYAFVINNANRLKLDIATSMSENLGQQQLPNPDKIRLYDFHIPQETLFTYNGSAKSQQIVSKNVYEGYLSSAEPRSDPEKKFEKFLEKSKFVKWYYKNGDKGQEYFSIVYEDNFGKLKSFFPDYIVCDKNDGIWILETKGGESKSGNSENIDKYSSKKFAALKAYLQKHNLKGGFVREKKDENELCICTEQYSDDLSDDNWLLLEDVLA